MGANNRGKAGIETRFKKGQSGNPKGRAKLPLDIKALKEEALQLAIIRLHEIVSSGALKLMSPQNEAKFMETVFDRFGLPKVTKEILAGDKNDPVVYKWLE